jgi:hypothetical protein
MSATNSGVIPDPGFTYANQFLFYARDQLRGPDGEVLATGANTVLMDMSSFVWVTKGKVRALGGARLSFSATIPLANNSLASDAEGAINGGGGLADSYYQPVILAWRAGRIDLRAAYGFLAPTGRFRAGATDNVGSGYWTHTLSAAGTLYLTRSRQTALSVFPIQEFHGRQEGTGIHPGQTLSLDYSMTHSVPLGGDLRLQAGLAGYSQWQTTDKTGPAITPAQAAAHYAVHSLGLAANVTSPVRRVNVGARYFKEYSSRSTFRGYSVQVVGAVGF